MCIRDRILSRLNPSNRRVRTRTHGGVGGEEPRGSPLSRFPVFARLTMRRTAPYLPWRVDIAMSHHRSGSYREPPKAAGSPLKEVAKCSQRFKTVADDLSNRQHGH